MRTSLDSQDPFSSSDGTMLLVGELWETLRHNALVQLQFLDISMHTRGREKVSRRCFGVVEYACSSASVSLTRTVYRYFLQPVGGLRFFLCLRAFHVPQVMLINTAWPVIFTVYHQINERLLQRSWNMLEKVPDLKSCMKSLYLERFRGNSNPGCANTGTCFARTQRDKPNQTKLSGLKKSELESQQTQLHVNAGAYGEGDMSS